MVINKANYCFLKNGIWYFRKKIPLNLNKKQPLFRVSLIALLGKKNYYNLLLNSSLFNVISILNNKVELLFLEKEKLTLEELSEYTKNLIIKYENTALIKNNDYLNFTREQRKAEELRFEGLSYFNDEGVKFGGHTEKALEKELRELKEAFDKDNKGLYRKKADDILKRQNIISKEELEKINEDEINLFSETLVKKEIEVINKDLENYKRLNSKSNNDKGILQGVETIEDFINKFPQLKNVLATKNPENWDLFIDVYLNNYKKRAVGNNTLRGIEVSLTIYKMLFAGDLDFGIPKRSLTEVKFADIEEIKSLLLEIPKLTQKGLQDWRKKGIIYTINFAKNGGYEKLLITGINKYTEVFIRFLKNLKLYEPEIYGNLNLDLFEKLRIEARELSEDDLKFNKRNKKIHLKAKIISNFLKDRYNKELEVIAGQAARNFTRNTGISPHIFWSVFLGIFTGARPEELAQLRICDIKKSEDGVFYLEINDEDEKSLKTVNAIRHMPICRQLIDLGFLNYIQERKNAKAKDLFDLKISKDGKRKEFQRNFNIDIKEYVKKYYEEDYKNAKLPSFYDLRSFFISKILKNNEDSFYKFIVLKKSVGHTIEALKKDLTLDVYDRENINYRKAYEIISDTDFEIEEGYNILKEKINKKYNNEILEELDFL
ncbi:hypothetical protein CRU92_08695 [Arcobacter sp. FW59]|nr:hypothetical protein CRU92_08695 [Arcobacter sp. FW59]